MSKGKRKSAMEEGAKAKKGKPDQDVELDDHLHSQEVAPNGTSRLNIFNVRSPKNRFSDCSPR